MNIDKKSVSKHYESRIPVILAILFVTFLNWALPERLSILPTWAAYVIGLLMILPFVVVELTSGKPLFLKIERYMLIAFLIFVSIGNLVNLSRLTKEMIIGSTNLTGLQLLESSVVFWVINVMLFSLLFWMVDRGGPEGRIKKVESKPDFLFPQESAPEGYIQADWRPVYIDYLYLGYSTATAFSTTEVAPITSRAKMMMLIESAISLVTILIVAARAINILGS